MRILSLKRLRRAAKDLPFVASLRRSFLIVSFISFLGLFGIPSELLSSWGFSVRVPLFGLLTVQKTFAASTATVPSPFHYRFSIDGVLEESGSMDESSSPYWWLNSGAKLLLQGGVGKTVQGPLPTNDYWRKLYGSTNPLDTANGYLPQNILRLVTRSSWEQVQQQVSFRIARLNMTASPQRNGSNGILLFNRYHDGNNLYYTGVRVDGAAVIKKKSKGTYTTLASKPVFMSAKPYNVNDNPNLLPVNVWMGLRSTVRTLASGAVEIKVYLDRTNNGVWQEILSAVDNGQAGGPAITGAGHGGIRTDFMDVSFDNFTISNL